VKIVNTAVAGIAAIVVVLAVSNQGMVSAKSKNKKATTTRVTTTKPTPAKKSAVSSRPATPTPDFVPSGQWLVGSEITPGTYRTTVRECYFERLASFTGDGIIDNGFTSANGGIVTILSSDKGFQSRCDWITIDKAPIAPKGAPVPTPDFVPSGQWLVGSEITPGTYRTTVRECYFERLASFTGEGIIDNGFTSANGGIITILSSDKAFQSRCDWAVVP
jgi:hypothetical protein